MFLIGVFYKLLFVIQPISFQLILIVKPKVRTNQCTVQYLTKFSSFSIPNTAHNIDTITMPPKRRKQVYRYFEFIASQNRSKCLIDGCSGSVKVSQQALHLLFISRSRQVQHKSTIFFPAGLLPIIGTFACR